MICLLPKPNGELEHVAADFCSGTLAVLTMPPLHALAYSFNDVVAGQTRNGVFYGERLVRKSPWKTIRIYSGDPASAQFASFVDEMERAGMMVTTNQHGTIAAAYPIESEHLARAAIARCPWEAADAMASVA